MTAAIVRPDGRMLFQGSQFRVALGRGGVRTDKQEGDGATPAGRHRLRRVLYRADRGRAPRGGLPREPIAETDGWCDDPTHRDYNRPVVLPFGGGHEELWRRDGLYDVVAVLGWNDEPVVRRRGSAIFLHVAHADFRPTDGCIAMALAELHHVLAQGLSEIEVMAA